MKSTFRRALWLPLTMLIAACVSAGVTETQINANLWEIRAWDGEKCDKHTPDPKCQAALMPVIREQAKLVCNSKKFDVSSCRRKPGVSGDRYYCSVSCDK